MSEGESSQIQKAIGTHGIVPVISIDDPASALGLADALLEGGLPVAEITFRTKAAAAAIEKIAANRPDIVLGAGTILTSEDLRRASDSGAVFGVSPGFNPKIVQEALNIGFSFFPGVMTPSDIEGALSFGIKLMKFFPAGAAGGIKMLSSISAPYEHHGLRFIPTGGINLDNMKAYLEYRPVLAIGGTWIATRQDIHDGCWKSVTDNCRKATAISQLVRSQPT